MNAKVRWTELEWSRVIAETYKALNSGELTTGLAQAVHISQKYCMSPERHRPLNSLYNAINDIRERYNNYHDEITDVEEVPQEVSQEVTPELTDHIRQIVREELERVFSMYFVPRTQTVNPIKPPDLNIINPSSIRKVRVDVIGLIGHQIEIVKNSAKDFNLRFIRVDDKLNNLAENVIICTKFVNHKVQDKARSTGCKIFYANGGASSVVQVLETIK